MPGVTGSAPVWRQCVSHLSVYTVYCLAVVSRQEARMIFLAPMATPCAVRFAPILRRQRGGACEEGVKSLGCEAGVVVGGASADVEFEL